LIFINNTPIFYLARKVLFDSTIELAFLFVIATTLFVYIEFNATWIMPFNGIVALFLSLACLRSYRNILQYYTEIRQECVANINRILHTAPDNLSEDEQKIHSTYAEQGRYCSDRKAGQGRQSHGHPRFRPHYHWQQKILQFERKG